MAVLSNRFSIKSLIKVCALLALVIYTEVEHFERSQIEEAWKWYAS